MCVIYVPGAQRPEEGVGSPGTGLTIQMVGCELVCGCWELKQGVSKNSQCSSTLNHLSGPPPLAAFDSHINESFPGCWGHVSLLSNCSIPTGLQESL